MILSIWPLPLFTMHILFPLLCLLISFRNNASTCPVQKGFSREFIIQLLDEGIRSGQNGVIPLHLQGTSAAVEIVPKPLSTENIIRAAEGETVQLHCNGSGMSTSWNSEDFPSQVWLDSKPLNFSFTGAIRPFGQSVRRCSCHGNLNGSIISGKMELLTNPLTGSMTVDLIELTHLHAGKYECVQYNGSQFVVTQTFLVSPQLIPSQVFKPPMVHVTARVGEAAEFACVVQFRAAAGSLENRFIWRSEDHVIYAPGIPEYRLGLSMKDDSDVSVWTTSDGICHCNSTLTIYKVKINHAGSYQCWFKIDDLFQEWVMQEAYLTVIR
ncbi:uncharacterized protein LOC129584386 [Paramacrobiotus metropolitanus]|uniref:uncharacterized protein LOC129584386 n=1 Tax=Paramacrobiotus metropolitanus TaxID=2943436 RepID=UPI0024463415|nr:uncharacterized protein LOC129584386 [Paramacrobiotus metropolitanus]